MCFSAAASFTAGAALSVVGVITVRRSRGAVELPLALVPLLFGIQQITEGVLWGESEPRPSPPGVVGNLPVLPVLPCAVARLRAGRDPAGRDQPTAKEDAERLRPVGPRRGSLPAVLHRPLPGHRPRPGPQHLLRLFALLHRGSDCRVPACYLRERPLFHPPFASPYSARWRFVLAIAAYQVSAQTFVSVCCFFAAILSLLVLIHFSGPMQACRPTLAQAKAPNTS